MAAASPTLGIPSSDNNLFGLSVVDGEIVHIAVNTGHMRKSRSQHDGPLRQFAVELQLRTALASGSIELDGALSVMRLSATKVEEDLHLRVSSGRELLVEWGVFCGTGDGHRLWDIMWASNRRLGRDIKRPAANVVLTVMQPALVHHASLCGMLDEFEEAIASAWLSNAVNL